MFQPPVEALIAGTVNFLQYERLWIEPEWASAQKYRLGAHREPRGDHA